MTVRLVPNTLKPKRSKHLVFLSSEGVILNHNLGASLSNACLKHGQQIALRSAEFEVSYQELYNKAIVLANRLNELGIEADEPVIVSVSNQVADVIAVLAVWLAHAVIVPVHRSSPPDVINGLQHKTKARFHINGIVHIVSEIIPPKREILGGAAFVIFTSGSTGEPKGVVVSHASFLSKITEINRLLNFENHESTLLVLNINFSFGLWVCLLTLLTGGRLVMQEKFEPLAFLNLLQAQQINRVGMVPTMMRTIFSKVELSEEVGKINQQSSLKQILIGGESLGTSLAQSIRKQFSNSHLIDIYGSTETATCDFFLFPKDFVNYPGCIGRPSGEVQFRIVDKNEEPLALGEIGELQIYSPFLMNGYLDDPHLTEIAYNNKWFKTGDLAREVDKSVVELMGRSKELISRGGNKITPGEIEQVICAHPDIAAAMAVGLPDDILGERIHVLLVLKVGANQEALNMRSFLNQKLEKYKQPDVFYLLSELPLGRTGKADRGQFKNKILSHSLNPISIT